MYIIVISFSDNCLFLMKYKFLSLVHLHFFRFSQINLRDSLIKVELLEIKVDPH